MKKKPLRRQIPGRTLVPGLPAGQRAAAGLRAVAAPEPSGVPQVLPHNPTLPDRARAQWLDADWQALAQMDLDALAHHPDRARLAALGGAAALQLGDRSAARAKAAQAMAWGCPRDFMGQVMLSGARHTLARASYFGGRDAKAEAHFTRAVSMARLSSEVRRLVQVRQDHVSDALQAAIDLASAQRRGGGAAAAATVPPWIQALARRCLDADDVHEAVDGVLATTLTLADDKLQFLMLLSDGFVARADKMTALHFLRQASGLAADTTVDMRPALARKLVALGSADSAVDVLVDRALADAFSDPDADAAALAARQAYQKIKTVAQASQEHGHDLLLAHLQRELAPLQAKAQGRQLTVIEIGTTREDVPGQGSTFKLADFCKRHGLRFVTVDMDPHNAHMARQTFASLGVAFEAVAMKGEDYLRDLPGEVDFVFLDAYDFDHGKHSELRQSRYTKFLGSRIDEEACHQMHLDCARTLATKLWAHGVVCVDDTWLDDGRWTAKGTLAMPFLLSQGFRLVEARNRAALLVRNAPAAA